MGKERLVAFTDAILAIIMTILVLELALTVYPPLMMYSVLVAALFILTTMHGGRVRNNSTGT